jgi:hypothetical protein
VIWFLILIIGTHLPQATPSEAPVFESPDKLLHFVCFGLLAFFFMCSRWVQPVWLCWLIVAIWAIVDETTQDLLPLNRAFSGEDLISGELGITAFMAWHGALSSKPTKHINDSVEKLLSKTSNWYALVAIGAGFFVAAISTLWLLSKVIIDTRQTGWAFFFAFLISIVFMLCFFVKKCSIPSGELCAIIKNMVVALVWTIVITAMVGIAVSYTTFDPWVAAMTVLVIGSRIAWNKIT